MKKVQLFLVAVIAIIAFSTSSYGGSGGNQPGPTPPPPKLLPDIKVEDIYFDQKCNLMIKLKNVGPGKFIGSKTGWRVFYDGNWAGSGLHNLKLFPNSTVKFMTLNSGILGVWVTEEKNWKIAVNEKGPIQGSSAVYVKESNLSNNTKTKKMMCKSLKIDKPPKKAIKIQPPSSPRGIDPGDDGIKTKQ